MPTQPDSIDIEQLRARLDALYEPTPESVEAVQNQEQPSNASYPQFGARDVTRLTMEAKSHSPEYIGPKVEHIAVYGTYINQLRTNMMMARNQ
jgi:hypothetical protein